MLKALELAGFKSFADKTRFDFPPGITVIVGPNGSGKSNIVDAIKWVLGEQSAKSLRGKDMSDVIFKGSGPSGRKALNTAEATIVFDNSDGRLSVDAAEVHVTRRVYRSGEGEYLINRQPCRLKDVRDLFRGTGVGTDAYSLIEQGKVDRLLQASPRDRRAIFEEAAGISRFKAKKIEAQRRLDRVEQNLLRLSDIVEEVGSRLRSVRSQATKARRYREYSDRLQQLRTQVGLTEWRTLSDKLQVAERELHVLGDESDRLSAELTAQDARSLELETDIASAAELIREREHRLARHRESVAAHHSLVDHERQHLADLDDQSARYRKQLVTLTGRTGNLTERLRNTRAQLGEVEAQHRAITDRLTEHDRSVADWSRRLEELRRDGERQREERLDAMRRSSQLANEVTLYDTQAESARATAGRCALRLEQLDATLARLADELEAGDVLEQGLSEELEGISRQLAAAELELADNSRLLSRRHDEVAAQQGRLSGVRERAALLEELEQRYEGLTRGVEQVLTRTRDDRDPRFRTVVGLVADVMEVPMQWAPLADAALGAAVQHVVLRDPELLVAIESGQFRPAGRVGFVWNEHVTAVQFERASLADLTGVLGRMDQLVEVPEEWTPLVRRLLGNTWAVEMLHHARALRAAGIRGQRFVTLAGEVVDIDGTVVTGPKEAAGLVSRRTELRDLRAEQRVLEQQIVTTRRENERLQENIEQQQAEVRRLKDRREQQSAQLSDQRLKSQSLRNQMGQLHAEREELVAERATATEQLQAAGHRAELARQHLATLEQQSAQLEQNLGRNEELVDDGEARLRECHRRATEVRVERAKSEQRLESLRLQVRQFEEDHRERARSLGEARQQLTGTRQRRDDALQTILTASSALALLYLDKEGEEKAIGDENSRRTRLVEQRAQLVDQIKASRQRLAALRDRIHQCELAAGEVRHERNSLAERLREDYGIEISELESEVDEEQQQQQEETEQEIASLRRKISNIGAVNMEALNELDDLELRFNSLNGQYQDLTQAKESLERIIHKINADSRRLFMETLEAIRTNFQSLYRKAFGGGQADIVLEEGVDILECGVDITATPPGKPSFSNSLLSGGERALTAMALLLAIFQYRPSPFCVLDEVDAPFDEANIGRFVDVLKEFLGWTKFVLVTHSKKTMTAASTLYGVTMQESGVSKQVSVRFEDVDDDGEISSEALDRARLQPEDDERGAA